MTLSVDDVDFTEYCKCNKCRYRATEKCKVINGTFRKIAYCRGPYKEV